MKSRWMTGMFLLATAGLAGAQAEVDRAAVEGNNAFAFELYGRLTQGEGNLAFSPLSLRTGLAMTYAGARGRTAEQMRAVLALEGEGELLHRALGGLARAADAETEGSELRSANALWGQTGLPFLPEFLELQQRAYGAALSEVDFGAVEEARATINGWVAERTSGSIPELLGDEMPAPGTQLVLTNAIDFRGAWAQAFAAKNTVERPFFARVGDELREISVPTMYQCNVFSHRRGATFALLELPYQGDALSMVLVLPNRRDELVRLERTLTSALLAEELEQLEPAQVGVFLPRFEATTKLLMKKELSALGMPDAFDAQRADFSGMTGTRDLWIDDVVHQVFVRVDERGTEAAAATAVMMKKSLPVFQADHPFLFLIRDRRTGAILFLGRITDPRGEAP